MIESFDFLNPFDKGLLIFVNDILRGRNTCFGLPTLLGRGVHLTDRGGALLLFACWLFGIGCFKMALTIEPADVRIGRGTNVCEGDGLGPHDIMCFQFIKSPY